MSKSVVLSVLTIAAFSSVAMGALSFHDDFESGMGNWTKWTGAAETLQLSDYNEWKSMDPGVWGVDKGYSALQVKYIGGGNGYASYHDLGVQSGPVRAEVYMFEDMEGESGQLDFGTLQLLADGYTFDNGGGHGADYLRVGVQGWNPVGDMTYSWAAKAVGWGTNSVNVARKKGWTKLAIEADGVGQQVRFYVDDVLIGTSTQTAQLRYVALGYNVSNGENFWYDGVRVTPEPASAALLLAGLGLIARKRRG